MKDFLGHEIKVGDRVIFMRLQYRDLCVGTILKLTPKTVLIECKDNSNDKMTCRQFYSQIIKYDTQEKNQEKI